MIRVLKYGRVVLWVVFVLTTGFLWQGQRDQSAKVSTAVSDLCIVVANVHDNAQFQYDAADDQLNQTLKYLADADPKDAPDLYKRVKANLPATRSRVAQTRGLLEATKPPESCTNAKEIP